jgi:hypothetical protein
MPCGAGKCLCFTIFLSLPFFPEKKKHRVLSLHVSEQDPAFTRSIQIRAAIPFAKVDGSADQLRVVRKHTPTPLIVAGRYYSDGTG